MSKALLTLDEVMQLPGWPQTVETWLHIDDVKYPIEVFVNADPDCRPDRKVVAHVYGVEAHAIRETKQTVYRRSTCAWFAAESQHQAIEQAKIFLSHERMKMLQMEMGKEKRRIGRTTTAFEKKSAAA